MKFCVRAIGAGFAALTLTAAASAQVDQYYGSQIVNVEGFCSFDNPGFFTMIDPYSEDGLTFWMLGEQAWGSFTGCNGDGASYYSDGGGFQPTQITRTDGGDFSAVEFQFSDGWGQCTNYGFAEILLDGNVIATFDVDGDANSTVVGFEGTFDEVRVAFFFDAATRDLHDNYGQYSAGDIDKVTFGTISGGGLELGVSGACPGSMTASATGATPNGNVAFAYAFGTGNQVIPSGPCAGTELGLNHTAALLGTAVADGSGNASLTGNAPAAACGRVFLQAVDATSCSTSNVVGI